MKNETGVRIISMDDIVKVNGCDSKQIMKIIERAFRNYKDGKIDLPPKVTQVFDPISQNRINSMVSTISEEGICGTKWISVFPNNPHEYGIPNVNGTIILSETNTGKVLAIMDGTFITAIRTACVGGIAAKYLAKKNSESYCSIGSGEEAKAHFIIFKGLFKNLKTCYVASRTLKGAYSFINQMKKKFPEVDFVNCGDDYAAAAKNADIIVTAVSCQKPLLRATDIKRGCFYCHVGGWEDEYAVPLMADKIVCDEWKSLKHRDTPTLSRLYKEGKICDENIYADLADIIDKTKMPRENDDEFIYFDSVGLGFVDVAVAYDIYKKAVNQNVGFVYQFCKGKSSLTNYII